MSDERSFADKVEGGLGCLFAVLPVAGMFISAGIGLSIGLGEILEIYKQVIETSERL